MFAIIRLARIRAIFREQQRIASAEELRKQGLLAFVAQCVGATVAHISIVATSLMGLFLVPQAAVFEQVFAYFINRSMMILVGADPGGYSNLYQKGRAPKLETPFSEPAFTVRVTRLERCFRGVTFNISHPDYDLMQEAKYAWTQVMLLCDISSNIISANAGDTHIVRCVEEPLRNIGGIKIDRDEKEAAIEIILPRNLHPHHQGGLMIKAVLKVVSDNSGDPKDDREVPPTRPVNFGISSRVFQISKAVDDARFIGRDGMHFNYNNLVIRAFFPVILSVVMVGSQRLAVPSAVADRELELAVGIIGSGAIIPFITGSLRVIYYRAESISEWEGEVARLILAKPGKADSQTSYWSKLPTAGHVPVDLQPGLEMAVVSGLYAHEEYV